MKCNVRAKVVGIEYDKDISNNFWNMKEKGEKITFKKEPTNEFDNKAIKVLSNGRQIGYIGRYLTAKEQVENNDPNNYVNGFVWITNEKLNNYISNDIIEIIRYKVIQYNRNIFGLEIDMKVSEFKDIR